MSADNWATCPRCQNAAIAAYEEQVQKVKAAYGKVPAEKYEQMRAALPTEPPAIEQTFREDYSIGVDGATFEVNYGGGCAECGLHHEFKASQEIKL